MRKLRTQVIFLTLSLAGVLLARHYVGKYGGSDLGICFRMKS